MHLKAEKVDPFQRHVTSSIKLTGTLYICNMNAFFSFDLFIVYIQMYQNVSNSLLPWNSTRRYEILHPLNLGYIVSWHEKWTVECFFCMGLRLDGFFNDRNTRTLFFCEEHTGGCFTYHKSNFEVVDIFGRNRPLSWVTVCLSCYKTMGIIY